MGEKIVIIEIKVGHTTQAESLCNYKNMKQIFLEETFNCTTIKVPLLRITRAFHY